MNKKDRPGLPILQDGMTVDVETYEGRPLSVKLPGKVAMKIVEAIRLLKVRQQHLLLNPLFLKNVCA